MATGVFKTSSIDSILCIACELPLFLRRQGQILKFITRIKNLADHITKNILHNPLPTNTIPNQCTVLKQYISVSENLSF